MLAKPYRFHGHQSLKFLLKRGQVISSPHFRIRYVLNPRRQSCRLAVVVSKKVDKRAVVRNRIRRRLYELFRRHWSNLAVNLDIVIFVLTPDIAEMEAKELQALLIQQLNQIRYQPTK